MVYLKFAAIISTLIIIGLHFRRVTTPLLVEFDLVTLPTYSISVNFLLDPIVRKFLIVVILISSRVIVYSNRYIDDEQTPTRFIFILTTFISRIRILISGASIPLLLLRWDGLGLSSYFLIVHYQSFKSSGRGLVTVIRNRIGDIFIIRARVIIISEITSLYFINTPSSINLISLLRLMILLGAITKRAMFPYCT